MKPHSLLAVVVLGLAGLVSQSNPALAEDKAGLRLNVSKKTLDRNDGVNTYSRDIDRTMALKASFRNISMKEMPEATVECIILIRRWSLGESDAIQRYTKTLSLKSLRPADETEMLVGEYRIGGHMHGTSDRHVDQLAGWKIIVTREGKATEFSSSSGFDGLNNRAVAGT